MIRVSTILVHLIVSIRVSKSETHKTRLQELTDFHTELKGDTFYSGLAFVALMLLPGADCFCSRMTKTLVSS